MCTKYIIQKVYLKLKWIGLLDIRALQKFCTEFNCPWKLTSDYEEASLFTKYSQLVCFYTRMTTFIKTKFNISDDQTNIDKYRLAGNITEYHIISKLILQRIIKTFVVQRIIWGKLPY